MCKVDRMVHLEEGPMRRMKGCPRPLGVEQTVNMFVQLGIGVTPTPACRVPTYGTCAFDSLPTVVPR